MIPVKSLKDVDVKGQRVLVRVDFNVPLDEEGNVADITRIEASLPTINYLIENKAKIILVSHLGRPKGKPVEEFKMDKVAKSLENLLGKKIIKIDDCIGEEVKKVVEKLQEGDILMLENVRFYQQEEDKDQEFVRKLSELADIFISDAFGVVHRDHASVSGVAEILPAYAGFLLEKEINVLSKLMENPEKPLTVIMGGAKIDTKIGVLREFLKLADNILIGGGMANTFLAAAGYNVGESLYQEDRLDLAREIMMMAEQSKVKFILPKDVVAASEIKEDAETLVLPIQDVIGDMKILDVGPRTLARYHQILQESKTVIWNGPVGLFECKPFQNGTKVLAKELARSSATTIIGGGDTIEAIESLGIDKSNFDHISTGGGAMLEFLEGRELPGIKVLYK